MNAELAELVRLYEAMYTCIGNEQDRTRATRALEIAIQQSAARTGLSFNLILRHTKELYHARARAEERRRQLPKPPEV